MMWIRNAAPKTTKSQTQIQWKINRESILMFAESMGSINWSPVRKDIVGNNPNRAYTTFISIYMENYNRIFPVITKSSSKAIPKQLWMSY